MSHLRTILRAPRRRRWPAALGSCALTLALTAGLVAAAGGEATRGWGDNDRGQLGNGTTTNSSSPAASIGVSGAYTIVSGEHHTLVLVRDGTVASWGANDGGQLGNGTTTNSSSPLVIAGLDHVIQVSAGGGHSMALKGDGTLWGWGHDSDYELGLPTEQHTPTQVPGLPTITAVAAGTDHTLALAADGHVWAWGKDDYGEAGQPATDICPTHQRACVRQPTQVPGLGGVVAIAAGWGHSLALDGNGALWAWGRNDQGQLGIGTSSTGVTSTPTQVTSLSHVLAMDAGNLHSLALTADNAVWAWGDNTYGQLGLGSADSTPHATPTRLVALGTVAAMDSGGYHTLALKPDGSVWSWGDNLFGQIGNGTIGTTGCQCSPSPAQVGGLSGLDRVAAGLFHSLALARPAYAHTEDTSLSQIAYVGTWTTHTDPRVSGGTVHLARLASASATFTWTGDDVRLILARGPRFGKAKVTLDGVASTPIDLYSASAQPQQVVFERANLPPGVHTLKLAPTGTKNPSSLDTWVPLDALEAR
jgi:alpha-tubulin suppressor-like RCC1 family protein